MMNQGSRLGIVDHHKIIVEIQDLCILLNTNVADLGEVVVDEW